MSIFGSSYTERVYPPGYVPFNPVRSNYPRSVSTLEEVKALIARPFVVEFQIREPQLGWTPEKVLDLHVLSGGTTVVVEVDISGVDGLENL